MGWLSRIFGHVGTVKFKGITEDGERFTGKSRIACIGMDEAEIKAAMKQRFYDQTGKKAKKLKITSYSGM